MLEMLEINAKRGAAVVKQFCRLHEDSKVSAQLQVRALNLGN